MVFIVLEIILLFKNLSEIKKIKSIDKNNIKFKIRTRNFKNIFYIIICSLFLFRNIEKIVNQDIDFLQFFSQLYFVTTILFIPLLISFIKLLFIESIITDDMIISNEGVFKMAEIQNINKLDERKLYIALKHANQYAINGTKVFKVKEEEIFKIVNFINSRIVYGSDFT